MTSTRTNLIRRSLMLSMMSMIATGQMLHAAGFELSWYTVDGGGAVANPGGAYQLSCTIGQPEASPAPAAGGDYRLTSGFWSVVVPGCPPSDFDGDCDVDVDDLGVFETCTGGPNIPIEPNPACQRADLDGDGDVDQSDFGLFQRCFSGAGGQADPNCAL